VYLIRLGARCLAVSQFGPRRTSSILRTETIGRDNRCVWGWRIRPATDGFPKGFRVQYIGIAAAKNVVNLPAAEIANYFRNYPKIAKDLLNESYDKRYSPSTFIKEDGDGFSVGWYSTKLGYECVREFPNLAEAATDYLLFSRGKRRWKPEPDAN